MTSLTVRLRTVALVEEAQHDSAQLEEACDVVGGSLRTHKRSHTPRGTYADARPVLLSTV